MPVQFCTVSCGGGGGGGSGGGCATSLSSTVSRTTGTATENVTAGARSVTLIVIAGEVDISIGGGGAVTVPAGWTGTWSGDNCGDNLADAFAFTGTDGSADWTVQEVRE